MEHSLPKEPSSNGPATGDVTDANSSSAESTVNGVASPIATSNGSLVTSNGATFEGEHTMTSPTPGTDASGLDTIALNITRQREERHEALRMLLDDRLQADGQVLTTKARMGVMDSYVGTASLRWIAQNVKLFINLPLMRNKIDDKGRLIIDEEIIDDLQQRAPDWSRQPVLTYYLIRNRSRKFPAILVVIEQDWVNDPDAPEWDANKRARKDSLPVTPLDSQGRVALLDLRNGVTIYVVDGQHRLLGVMGLVELLRNGYFTIKAADGRSRRTERRDELLEHFSLTDADLIGLEDEVMGIEFLPAVLKGETREEARRRIRTTFVHVNKTARPLTQGELAVLDEDDGFAIVAREIGLRHPILHRDTAGDRVNWKSTALPSQSKWLTAVATLKDMAEGYLGSTQPFKAWVPERRGELPVRPLDPELDTARSEFAKLWDQIALLPSFADVKRGGNIDEWREFPPKGKGHLLMRPLGQLILAEAVGFLHLDENGPQLALDKIFDKLQRFDQHGGFENVNEPSSAWYGITFDPVRDRMIMTGRHTAVEMLKHLVYGLTPAARDSLLVEFRRLRSFENGVYYNYDGKTATNVDLVQLPPQI